MSLMTIYLYSILLITLVTFAARRIYFWQRLRHIPGPTTAAWTIWWQLSNALSGRYHERLKEAADTYGPLVRIGPNQLLSTDPEVLRRMSAVRSGYTKGKFYASGKIVPGVDNVVSLRDPAKHKEMRALMAPGFSGKANEGYSFEAAMNRQLLSFIDLLERKYVTSGSDVRPFDMAEKTQFFALDAIGDISLGQPFGYLDKDEDLYQYNEINTTSLPLMNVVSVMPALANIVHTWPLRLLLPKEGDQVGFGRLMRGMSKNDLIQQVFLSIIAGSNSSAHALRMTLLSIITSPPAYNALIDEIRRASPAVSSPITWAQAQTLPYLQAVIREGLRMWPPVGGLGFKTVPPEGDHVNGYFVPGGTEIGQGFHGVGRSKAVWGPDADVFRPERWLDATGDRLKEMTDAVDTHFGYGKYSCLGKPIAMMELHKAVFELVRRFDFCVVNPESPIKTTASIFLFASDFWVTLTKRNL
ncbi:cytochrome P450 monooxygenase ABA1 [Trichoderma asperellum]|uniref:Cytochrome P450 monooxygenase ABA1 n=1 Tax=Trichoderma asperellum TaxID=101201 RepID=A0A6V8QVB5_TRIAP|nr:cytochrome P450 monooxygenase ABA1 [Trichoderma asperellum]